MKVIEGDLILKENTAFNENIRVNGHIKCEGGQWNIEAWDIKARDIEARDIKALNIKAWDIKALNIKARDITELKGQRELVFR